MNAFIKIVDKNLFLLSVDLLGVKKAQLWIGNTESGHLDDDDDRVLKDREEAEFKKGNISGIEAMDISESTDYPGFYEVNTSTWPRGIYRFNAHSYKGVQAPKGSLLDDKMRDMSYSWVVFSNEQIRTFSEWFFREPNNRGFCLRIKKEDDGTLSAKGNPEEWLKDLEQVQEKTEAHFQTKKEESLEK